MRKKRSLCLLAASLILSGCGTSTPPSARPTLPLSISAPCPRIPVLETDDWDVLALAHIELATQYGACAAKHDAAVRAWTAPPAQ